MYRNQKMKQGEKRMVRKEKFSLIELQIVVSVIAIIASLLLPALNQARVKGMSAACLANLKQIGVGAAGYAGDFDDWVLSMRPNTAVYWQAALRNGGYVSDETVLYQCPGEVVRYNVKAAGLSSVNKVNQASYGIHQHATGMSPVASINTGRPSLRLNKIISSGGGSSHPVNFADGTPNYNGPVRQQQYQGSGVLQNGGIFQEIGASATNSYPVSARHLLRANATFFDGHAESLSMARLKDKRIWYPKYYNSNDWRVNP